MYFLFGKPDTVGAYGSSVTHSSTIDNVTAILSYKKMQAVINASQTMAYSENRLLIIGTEGRIEIENCFSQTYIPSMKIISQEGTQEKKYNEVLLYKNEMESILGVSSIQSQPTSFEDAVDETRILNEINHLLKLQNN